MAATQRQNELVSKYYKEMYAFIYKQTLNTELSLDLTQELFISVLKSIHNYDSKKAAFRTWLYKLASNRIEKEWRRFIMNNEKFHINEKRRLIYNVVQLIIGIASKLPGNIGYFVIQLTGRFV